MRLFYRGMWLDEVIDITSSSQLDSW